MTTPSSDSFQYNDDSVVARVSFDVPPSTLTDITQITQAMSAMRTELESIARAQSDWLDYLQQVPAIAERANQAYRDSITQMERIAYIQSEIGTNGPMGAPGAGGDDVASGGPSGGTGGGAGNGYSTAAPAGYVPPFRNMTDGMGTARGADPAVENQISSLVDENPRIAANMAAARGMAVNPSLLGMVGGALGFAVGPGSGNETADNMSPQTTGKDRTSSGPPSSSQGGAPIGSDPTDIPGPPSEDAPQWRQMADKVTNEIRNAAGGSRIGKILGSIPPGVLGDAFKRGGDATEGDGGGGAGGGPLGAMGPSIISEVVRRISEAGRGSGPESRTPPSGGEPESGSAGGESRTPPGGGPEAEPADSFGSRIPPRVGGYGTEPAAPGGDSSEEGVPGDGSRMGKLGRLLPTGGQAVVNEVFRRISGAGRRGSESETTDAAAPGDSSEAAVPGDGSRSAEPPTPPGPTVLNEALNKNNGAGGGGPEAAAPGSGDGEAVPGDGSRSGKMKRLLSTPTVQMIMNEAMRRATGGGGFGGGGSGGGPPTDGGGPDAGTPEDGGDGEGTPGDGSRVGKLEQMASMLPGGKIIGKALKSPAGKAALKGAGVTGLAIGGYNIVQDVGERMTRLQQVGSEEGGDYATGLKEELHSRMIGLDPFITTDQAREATQRSMSAGLQGDSRDQFRDMMLTNFKELGMAFGQSATLELTNLRGQKLTDENVLQTRSEIDATVNTMKELAGDGGNTMALSERLKQLEQMTKSLKSVGFSTESIDRSALISQEGNKDSLAAREAAPRLTGEAMNSNLLLSLVGTRVGVTDAMPGAMQMALEEAGYDPAEIEEIAYQEAAKVAAQEPKWYNRVAAFQTLMAQMGVNMDAPLAMDKYEQYAPPGRGKDKSARGENKTPVQKGKEAIAAKGEKNEQPIWNRDPISGIADTLGPLMSARSLDDFKNLPGDMWDGLMGRHKPSENAQRTVDSFRRSGNLPDDDQFGPAGQQGRKPLPKSPQEAAPQTITTQGQVQGEVRITVDQQGRVTAPPTIQLSGTQRAVNSGQGAGTLNAAAAASEYAVNTFPGGQS